MSVKMTDIDFAAAKEALGSLDKTLGNFGFVAPEDSGRLQEMLNRIARHLNEFATAMRLIKQATGRLASDGFNVGDLVEWTSQSGGSIKTKRGEIVEVVSPRSQPSQRHKGFGGSRDHVSYTVRAGGRLYWPLVKNLRAVTSESEAV